MIANPTPAVAAATISIFLRCRFGEVRTGRPTGCSGTKFGGGAAVVD